MEQQHPAPGLEQVDDNQTAGFQRYNDEFMMFVFKVQMCKRVDKHNREQCPYAHPGELARRRHPSLYQALPCPEARAKKICPRLEDCNCSHSTFEFWLHPDRYKTFLCERGEECNRPVCFFAHSKAELRELPRGLQRTKPTHKPPSSSSHSADSHTAGAGSSRQAAAGAPAEFHSLSTNAMIAQGPGAASPYFAQPVHVQQAQLQQQAGVEPGQATGSYTASMPQPQQQAFQQQGVQYVAVPVRQPRSSDPGLGSGTEQPSMLMQQGRVLYAPPLPGADLQQLPGGMYPTYQQQPQTSYSMQPVQPGMAPYSSSLMSARPQVLIGYQPIPVASDPGCAGAHGMVMVRPANPGGSTVAVIPAGPSAWASSVSAESGEAPSLEALCAAMGQMSTPASEHPQHPELLLQYQQAPHIPGQQQQMPGQHMLSGQPMLQQQQQPGFPGQHLMYAAPAGLQQALAVPLGQQELQQQLLPGQQVMVVLPSAGAGASLQPSQPGWGGMGNMQL